MNEKKMVNAAGTFDTLAKVAGGIFRAAGIVCAVFAVLVLIVGSAMYQPGSVTLDLDFVKLHLAEEYQTITTMMKLYTVVGLAAGTVLCFTVDYALRQLRKVLAPMKEGRPFAETVPASLRKVAWSVLAGGALVQVAGAVERFLLTKVYPMEEIFSSSAVSKIEYVFTADFGFVLIACVLLFLSYVFSYGQKLQQESDETL